MRHSLLLALALALAVPAAAQNACTGTAGTDFQEVTLREINALPQASIDALNAGAPDGLSDDEIRDLLRANPLTAPAGGGFSAGTVRLQIKAVLLTDPILSGLATANNRIPGRIHVFIRDVAAETEGLEGMGGQIVDGRGDAAIQGFFAGDEVTICATADFFGNIIQLSPEAIVNNENPRAATDPIRQPVVITTDVVHDAFEIDGSDRSQVDWDVYSDYVNQYVRFEGIELVQGVPAGNNGRPNMLFSTQGEDTTVRSYDTSVCFRNDRDETYFPEGLEPACNQTDFIPPPTGVVNVQGFLSLPGFDGAFNSAVPSGGAAFSINPFEESDFEIAVAPPILSLDDPAVAFVGGGAAVKANVTPGTAGNTIASVVVDYTTSSGGSGQVALSNTAGDDYEGVITGLTEDDFLTYTVTATDNEGASAVSSAVSRRVINGPVSSIFTVQGTADGGPGDSGITSADPIAFDLDAVVMAVGTFGGRFQATIQDDPTLGPFSGVLMDFGSEDPGLSVGDQITISEARVSEFRDVTQLVDVTFTTTGSGDPYGDKVVTTAIFNGADGDVTAEQHEGMMLRFEDNVTITSTNPDAPSGPFGEFAFATGSDDPLRADDASDDIAQDFAGTLSVGQPLDSIRGIMSFSFGNYKILPPALADIDIAGIDVGTGPGELAAGIVGTYPNPAVGAVRVRFELAEAGPASLRLFDLTGREVAVVAEGAFSAAAHDVTADLGGLASGVYVLRLSAGGDVVTARIAVVR